MNNSDPTSEINLAKQTISEIENGLSNPESIFHRTILNKGELLRLLAASYETLCVNKVMDLQVNHIANHIMKKVKELNSELSSTRIYDSLPAKYKYHTHNPIIEEEDTNSNSQHGNENASYILTPKEENKPEIDFWRDQIKLCKKIITHLESNSFLQKKESDNYLLEKEYSQELIMRKAAQKFLDDAYDDRKTVPINTIHILIDTFIHANNNYAASVYISKLKEYGSQKKQKSFKAIDSTFSSKQLTKILKGHVRELHISQEILTQDDAYDNGFYGKSNCSECGAWRVILQQDYRDGQFGKPVLSCFVCGKETEPPKVKLHLSHPTPRPE